LIKDSSGNVVAPNATCYRFGYKDLETNLLAGVSGKQLVDPAGLGQAGQIADFVVEMSDRAPASDAVPGMARSGYLGQVNMKYWNVTLPATGQVRPTATYDPLSATTTHESMRFHLTVGPF